MKQIHVHLKIYILNKIFVIRNYVQLITYTYKIYNYLYAKYIYFN